MILNNLLRLMIDLMNLTIVILLIAVKKNEIIIFIFKNNFLIQIIYKSQILKVNNQ